MEPKALWTDVCTTIPFANIHIDPDAGRDNYCAIFPATSS
jgi:hypothetical protein